MQDSATALRMAEAAGTFLSSLSAEERRTAVLAVEGEERRNWHYVPRLRNGMPLREMSGAQRKLAHALVAAGLSRIGYSKAMSIMALESILKQIEGTGGRFVRDPDLYIEYDNTQRTTQTTSIRCGETCRTIGVKIC